MSELAKQECTACRGDVPPMELAEAENRLKDVPGWEIVDKDEVPKLVREYKFKNFAEALQFTQQVGELAESANHHPAILTEWGKVKVTWWTHKIGGLHDNDFIMAARTDTL